MDCPTNFVDRFTVLNSPFRKGASWFCCNPEPRTVNRTLGIDHGTVRIGLALSDDMGMFAHPLKTLDASPSVEEEIATIVQQKRVATVVIGLPLRMSGERGSAAERVDKFADRLRKE